MAVLFWRSRFAGLCIAMACGVIAAGHVASASTYKVLYSFCQQSNCTDGKYPYGGLVEDSLGNLFGTAEQGGDADSGVMFELVRSSDGTSYIYKRLYSFCARADCADGGYPLAGPVMDSAGNLYGVTSDDSVHAGGTAYEMTSDGKYHVLYRFCRLADCSDGRGSEASLEYEGRQQGLPYDGTSPLYGTGSTGGRANSGVVFRLVLNGKWREQVLYDFCPGTGCPDGANPSGGVTLEETGAIVGTTANGGLGHGVVFRLFPGRNRWSEEVLHTFCADQMECSDGAIPASGVIEDSSGQVMGAAQDGGHQFGGVLFQMDSDGSRYRLFHRFCTVGRKCVDGEHPDSLVLDRSGNVFGTTFQGGSDKNGVLFQVSGSQSNVLYSFCAVGGHRGSGSCSDGANPSSVPLIDSAGNVFGTAIGGGTKRDGIVYQFTP